MPDAVRALTGFFLRLTGTKCSGDIITTYQTGGKYWYFMEMKNPGFLTSVWKLTSGDLSSRVQQVTGGSMSSMADECKATGMP